MIHLCPCAVMRKCDTVYVYPHKIPLKLFKMYFYMFLVALTDIEGAL